MFQIITQNKTKTKVYPIKVEAQNGEKAISFPDEMGLLKYWRVGETTYWVDHGNGSWSIYVDQIEEDTDDSEVQSD